MKISYMLKREDFYTINRQTLTAFFPESGDKTPLYVYPNLNAIVCRCPSRSVKKYIYTEYSLNTSLFKRFLVWGYTRLCMNTFGLLAAKRVIIPSHITRDTLIFPCNRKFRIFSFNKNIVSVTPKAGFPTLSLQSEISFRKHCKPCNFILPLVAYKDCSYTEKIIDGIPLARIISNFSKLKQEALTMWQEYCRSSRQTYSAPEYAQVLSDKLETLTIMLHEQRPAIDVDLLKRIASGYLNVLKSSDEKIVTLQSHGDLQPGNIWVENGTNQIFIIDWETVDRRSIWYDEAVLNEEIRIPHRFDAFRKKVGLKYATVVLEEIIYRINELSDLPDNLHGGDFNSFIKNLEK